jgi:GMP synthase-like glutamine amidotransferase
MTHLAAVDTSTSVDSPSKSFATTDPSLILKSVIVAREEHGSETVVGVNSHTEDDEQQQLNLIFLGCEAKPPYGPYDHTAGLFLDLIGIAIRESEQRKQSPESKVSRKTYAVTLQVYHTSQGSFPISQALDNCDGVIIPGSFNSAYDEEPWIHELKNFIQGELVSREIPTLGVCFGHQIYAHSFSEDGSAIKCPAGPQAGRRTSLLTTQGQKFLFSTNNDDDSMTYDTNAASTNSLDLFYTHGDMVEKLPSHASALGGNEKVPIQAAIYHSRNRENPTKIVAVTFQAHPEYASSKEKGLEMTLHRIIEAMKERGDITDQERRIAMEDAIRDYERVREQSVNAMICAGQKLGWFS